MCQGLDNYVGDFTRETRRNAVVMTLDPDRLYWLGISMVLGPHNTEAIGFVHFTAWFLSCGQGSRWSYAIHDAVFHRQSCCCKLYRIELRVDACEAQYEVKVMANTLESQAISAHNLPSLTRLRHHSQL